MITTRNYKIIKTLKSNLKEFNVNPLKKTNQILAIEQNFKKITSLTSIFILTLIFLSIIFQFALFAQNWNLNVSAQNTSFTNLNSEQNLKEIDKLNLKFDNRQLNYFEEEASSDFSLKQDLLTDFKVSLQQKINQEQENQRLEQEKAKLEAEKIKLEEEARIKREQETKAKLESEAKAKQEAEKQAKKPIQTVQAPQTPKVSFSSDKYELMRQAGISENDMRFVDYIVTKESNWNHLVWNKAGSGAYGLCQSLPAKKMASAGSDYMTNPITQLKWCAGYATSRYGGWAQAYSFWTNNKWW
jgi:hypothetical protein